MTIVHHFLNRSISFESDFIGVLATDNIGGYFLLTKNNQTRYQGWHIRQGGSIFKVVDSITPLTTEMPSAIENRIWKVRRSYNDFFDEIILPFGFPGLFYKLSASMIFNVRFDIKKGYESPVDGRMYKVNILDKKTFHIHFEQVGQNNSPKNFSLDVIGKIDSGNIIKKESWELVEYNYDKYRESAPFDRWIFNAISINGAKELIMAVGRTFDEAKKNLNKIYKNRKIVLSRLRKINESQVSYHKNIPQYISWSLALCKSSLKSLLVLSPDKRSVEGLYAGLPWFYQFWLRDEAISITALYLQDKNSAKNLSIRRLRDFLAINNLEFEQTQSLDGIMLYLKNISDICFKDNRFFSVAENKLLLSAYIHIAKLLRDSLRDGLLFCDGSKTWMDSIKRSDFAVEIQFLYAAFLKNFYTLTKNPQVLNSLNQLTQVVRREYYKDGMLYDGVNDRTIRPNIFLAYYYYPRILRESEWKKAVDLALDKLYLSWGGLATIDKTDHRFNLYYTGENPKSYHQGDSWFYINNIAAQGMLKLDPVKYSYAIKSIIQSSSQDILKSLIPGHLSELSSADRFSPSGSFCQLWSAATFIELIKKIYPKI